MASELPQGAFLQRGFELVGFFASDPQCGLRQLRFPGGSPGSMASPHRGGAQAAALLEDEVPDQAPPGSPIQRHLWVG